MSEPADRDEIARLTIQRDELRARLESLRSDLRQPLDADSEERAIQLETREVLEGVARVSWAELTRVEQRLATLSDPR